MNKNIEGKYALLDSKGIHDYNIIIEEKDNGVQYSLYSSNGNQWANEYKGKLLLQALDNGNEVKFNKKIGNLLDYSEFGIMITLLTFMKEKGNYVDNYKVYKEE